ncbi:MAG: transporter substrate-binding domain-containing protein, partial [Paludibacteraceae bacterium]|nr:transporter substrate-binding domain-containing protein [Paludibacteraceae bacterium]
MLIIGLFFYQKHEEETMIFPDWKEIKQSDTLKVGMIYNSHSYFILKDQEMGYDYELIKKFADKHNFTLQIHIAQSETELLRLLTYNTIDLIAYPIMMTLDRKQKIRFLENEQINNQVLVQRKGRGELTSPTELIGQSIVVPKNSKYEKRLIHLNEELGGGIYIQTVDDTTAIETLIRQVAQRDIDYTIADNNIALLNKTYYRNIDCKTAISFSQRSAWAVNNSTPILADSINQWIRQQKNFSDNLYNKYFVKAKYFNSKTVRIPRGAISPYDDLFKQYAPTIPW